MYLNKTSIDYKKIDELKQICSSKEILEGYVHSCDEEYNLHVNFLNITGIVPRNEVSCIIDNDGVPKPIASISKVGHMVKFRIKEIDIREDSQAIPILSMKEVEFEARKWIFENLKDGDILQGVVRNIEQYGVFIDIGVGITGLLHIEDISIARIRHPNERFNIGDKINVLVKNFDKETGRILFSHKELLGTWEENVKDYRENTTVIGIARDKDKNGIFIELKPNLVGLADYKRGISYGEKVVVHIKKIVYETKKIKLQIINQVSDTINNYTQNTTNCSNIEGIFNIKHNVYIPEKKEVLPHNEHKTLNEQNKDDNIVEQVETEIVEKDNSIESKVRNQQKITSNEHIEDEEQLKKKVPYIQDEDIKADISPFAVRENEVSIFDGKNGYASVDQFMFQVNAGYISEIHFVILEIINEFQFITSRQMYQLMYIRGVRVKSQKALNNKLEDLIKCKAITRFYFESDTGKGIFRTYCMEKIGKYALKSRGIYSKWVQTDNAMPVWRIKRRLSANQALISYMQYLSNFKGYIISPILRIPNCGKYVKPAEVIFLENSSFVFEIVRRFRDWQSELLDKMYRYKDFYTTFQPVISGLDDLPKFVIVGEDEDHIIDIADLINENRIATDNMELYYTFDLKQLGKHFKESLIKFEANNTNGEISVGYYNFGSDLKKVIDESSGAEK